MPYLYLISSVFFMSSSSVFGAFYNRKSAGKKDAPALYSFIYLFTVFLGWAVLFAITPSFEWKVLPYSLAFGAFYTVCQIGNINALKTGPTVLTSLMLQLSLIAVTAWGFFFWDSEFTWLVGVGLILVALALWLCLYTGKKKGWRGQKDLPEMVSSCAYGARWQRRLFDRAKNPANEIRRRARQYANAVCNGDLYRVLFD